MNQIRLYDSYGYGVTRPALPPRDGSTKGLVGEREVDKPVDYKYDNVVVGRATVLLWLRLEGSMMEDCAELLRGRLFCVVFRSFRRRSRLRVSWFSSGGRWFVVSTTYRWALVAGPAYALLDEY